MVDNMDRYIITFWFYLKRCNNLSSTSEDGDGDRVLGVVDVASRGFNSGVGAYFTVCGPISRRQSEPARIHHRVTPRNNLLDHNELLSKPSYLFISPRLLPHSHLHYALSLFLWLQNGAAFILRTNPTNP